MDIILVISRNCRALSILRQRVDVVVVIFIYFFLSLEERKSPLSDWEACPALVKSF